MVFIYFLTFLVGFASVLQGGLNRQIANSWGYSGATLLSSFFLLATSTIFFCGARFLSNSDFLVSRNAFQKFPLWYCLPGILGFCIVFLVPYIIQKIGALELFIALIASQLVASSIWDYTMENRPINIERIVGAALAFAGAVIASVKIF